MNLHYGEVGYITQQKRLLRCLMYRVSHAYKVIREANRNYLLKAFMSEPAESAVSILTVKI